MPVLYRPRGAAASLAPPASEAPANAKGNFDPALYPSLVAASPPPTALSQPRAHVKPPSSPSGVNEAVYEAANYPTLRWHPANEGTDGLMPVLYRPRGAAASLAPPASEAPANAKGNFDPALYPSLVAASPPPTALSQPRAHVKPPSSPSGVNEAVYEAANYLDELAALSSSADDTALTAPALPRRRPSILYAPRGHAAPPKDPATAAAAIQSSPRMDDQGGITPVMTPVMTPVIVRSDAPSYRYDARAVLSTRLTHRVGTVSGAVMSAISHIRRVTGVATRRTLWSSGPRWGAVTVNNGPEGASAAGVAVTVNGPEGASAAGGHADHADTGLSGDRVEVLVEVPAGGDGHGETNHELPTVLTDHRQRLRGRAEDRAGVACRVECECHVMSRETGPAVRLLVRVTPLVCFEMSLRV